MKLAYHNPDETLITVILDAGESLGNHHGPLTITVPVEEANTEYAAIRKQGLDIKPHVPEQDPV